MIHTLSGDTSPNQFPAISAQQLGATSFRADYGVKYAYVSGGMYRGIASAKLVIAMAQAGLLGSGGSSVDAVDQVQGGVSLIRNSKERLITSPYRTLYCLT
ncbi:hypothetical protein [Pseudoalteromonas rubra]|uniref:Uncharacterized protein n=1 Tax=Pseudoalteromonas rubra TaxID=43658 RepID=A0A0U2P767_9GAMM|nr:hypothetical protein [Pseudoalteromonas rubra]ALU42989.1 hypothetical protein AT705_08545 [Pseudoalteromonas rubra]